MRRLGSVQQKIPCVFLTEVRNEPSRKRDCQVGGKKNLHLCYSTCCFITKTL